MEKVLRSFSFSRITIKLLESSVLACVICELLCTNEFFLRAYHNHKNIKIETSFTKKSIDSRVYSISPVFHIAVSNFCHTEYYEYYQLFHCILRSVSHFRARTNLVTHNDKDDFQNLVSVESSDLSDLRS